MLESVVGDVVRICATNVLDDTTLNSVKKMVSFVA